MGDHELPQQPWSSQQIPVSLAWNSPFRFYTFREKSGDIDIWNPVLDLPAVKILGQDKLSLKPMWLSILQLDVVWYHQEIFDISRKWIRKYGEWFGKKNIVKKL